MDVISQWAQAHPFWMFAFGMMLATVIAYVHLCWYAREFGKANKALDDINQKQKEHHESIVAIHIDTAYRFQTLLEESSAARVRNLEHYRAAWVKVAELLKTFRGRLSEHESANIMEKSLIRSLDCDALAVEQLVGRYLIQGCDPEGKARAAVAAGKTVKNGTDAEGTQHGQEEVSRVQAANEVSQEHERQSE